RSSRCRSRMRARAACAGAPSLRSWCRTSGASCAITTAPRQRSLEMDSQRIARLAGQVGVFVVFFVLWEVLVRLTGMNPVILPAPSLVFVTMAKQWPYLVQHTWPTAVAIVGGFLVAAVSGFILAVAVTYSRWVNELVYPFLIVSQVLPKIALAPLFLIW